MPVIPPFKDKIRKDQEFKVILSHMEFKASLGYMTPYLKCEKKWDIGKKLI